MLTKKMPEGMTGKPTTMIVKIALPLMNCYQRKGIEATKEKVTMQWTFHLVVQILMQIMLRTSDDYNECMVLLLG